MHLGAFPSLRHLSKVAVVTLSISANSRGFSIVFGIITVSSCKYGYPVPETIVSHLLLGYSLK